MTAAYAEAVRQCPEPQSYEHLVQGGIGGGHECHNPACVGGWIEVPIIKRHEYDPNEKYQRRHASWAWPYPGDWVLWFDRGGYYDGLWYEAAVTAVRIDEVSAVLEDGLDVECPAYDLRLIVDRLNPARPPAMQVPTQGEK